jgi:hypothetical protein
LARRGRFVHNPLKQGPSPKWRPRGRMAAEAPEERGRLQMIKLSRRIHAAGFAMFAAVAMAAPAQAGPKVIDLVFYSPYLANAGEGTVLSYRFERSTEDKKLEPSFQDDVTLKIAGAGDARTVRVDLFSGKRAQTVGPLPSTGNGVVLAMMEQDVKEMQKVLGGSPYYIRNRLREALTNGEASEPARIDYRGRTVDGWKVTVKPFEKDVNRDKLKEFADRVYELTFSENVPGGLYSIRTVTPGKDGAAPLLVEQLTLTADNVREAAK